eukprot:5187187-Amphidinium_carterae.1
MNLERTGVDCAQRRIGAAPRTTTLIPSRARGGTCDGLESELGVFHTEQTACTDFSSLAGVEEVRFPLQQTVPEPGMDGGRPPVPGGVVQKLGGHGCQWQPGCAG